MNILHRFRALPKGVSRRLPSALGAVVTAGLLLRVLPYRRVRRLLDRVRRGPTGGDPAGPTDIGRAVEVIANRIPAATCLVRGAAAEWLLLRGGYPASLHLGVASDAPGKIRAHAWVESDGEAVIGTPEPGEYAPLVARARPPISIP